MTDQRTAYELARQAHEEHGIPSFPVLLQQDENGKWQKTPLVKWGSITRSTHPGEFNWRRANAVGVPMGSRSGHFTFDLDDYKPQSTASEWVKKHGLPPTRTHRTVSGGTHLIFRMPEGLSFGNAAPKVHGLDVRGDGGYIVWADEAGLYSVVDDRAPVDMPQPVIDVLVGINQRRGLFVRESDVQVPRYVSDDELMPKLQKLLADPFSNRELVNRWKGGTAGLSDRSRSAMDMSVASLLAHAGLTYDEVATALLRYFPHGKANHYGWTDAVERECCRCAYKAVTQREDQREFLQQELAASLADKTQQLAGKMPWGARS